MGMKFDGPFDRPREQPGFIDWALGNSIVDLPGVRGATHKQSAKNTRIRYNPRTQKMPVPKGIRHR